jgi:hypothetical protein
MLAVVRNLGVFVMSRVSQGKAVAKVSKVKGLPCNAGVGFLSSTKRAWRNGRRARLRIWSRKGWRFKSSRAHPDSLRVEEEEEEDGQTANAACARTKP